jgi:hypothetical protein
MELTHHSLLAGRPQVRAWALTWLWEPEPGTGERIAALLSLQPHPGSTTLLSPAAHILLPRLRLSAMLGRSRADSAYGILRAAADFMTHRLIAGAAIEDCAPPFQGFYKGGLRQALGFNTDQLVDAAVRSASSFGHPDEIVDELVTESNHSTETTREFLARVQTAMAPANDEKRKRFNKRVQLEGANMVIDYAHQRHLVQFATAPLTERQQQNMLREAKAKLFEAQGVAQRLMEGNGEQTLVVNTSAVWGASGSGTEIASATISQFRQLAALANAHTVEASSHEEAVRVLAAFDAS